ncbi:hypothetical protein EJF36_10840 [Bacillus sp. HMF5848]|nr:hypothetical protein EJF36_10840 [Bacillus sp. HMF5848]
MNYLRKSAETQSLDLYCLVFVGNTLRKG